MRVLYKRKMREKKSIRFLRSNIGRVFTGGFFPPTQKVSSYKPGAKNENHDIKNVHKNENGDSYERKIGITHKEPAVVSQSHVK